MIFSSIDIQVVANNEVLEMDIIEAGDLIRGIRENI
jgi:hypothetical protein